MDWFLPTLLWYLATTVIALAIAPAIATLFQHVNDHGVSLARPLSLLVAVWPVWFLASLGDGWIPFNGVALWTVTVLLGLICWPIGFVSGAFSRSTFTQYGLSEIAYLTLFVVLVGLRGFIPGVGGPSVSDQEKPMDLMMLASSMQASSMPPADSWMAGETINYYYLGYALWGAVGSMAGTAPAITYNLAVVSIIAMTIIAVAGTVGNILAQYTKVRPARIGGLIAVGMVVLIGTPWAAWQVVQDPAGQWQQWPFDGIMWEATRIIPVSESVSAISEFPAFTFLFADLHPHMMAIPFAICALGIAWMLATLPAQTSVAVRAAQLALAGLLSVGLYAINSWDFPTWFAVVSGGLLISTGYRTIGRRLAAVGVALVTGLLAWSPFILDFEAPLRTPESAWTRVITNVPVIGDVLASITAFSGERTTVQDWMSIFGFFYPVIVIAVIAALISRSDTESDGMITTLTIISGIIIAAIGLLLPAPLVIVIGLPLLLGLAVVFRSTTVSLELIIVGLGSLSLLLSLLPEFFFLYDVFGTRMNTIFKLYLQSWLLGGIATALALVWLWQRTRSWITAQVLLAMVTVGILAAGATYPVVGASQWIQFKNPDVNWEGMDGLAWLEASDPASYDALQWLWENGSNDDVLLAAGGCAYRAPIGFPAAASGVPTIIGWDNHERQWRLSDDDITAEIQTRVTDVIDLFARPTDELLDEYGVTLLYIGRAETEGVAGVEPSDTCAPGPFPETLSSQFPGPGWTEVFNDDGVRILRRDPADES